MFRNTLYNRARLLQSALLSSVKHRLNTKTSGILFVKLCCHMIKVAVVFVKVDHQEGVEEEVGGQGEKCFVSCVSQFFLTFLFFNFLWTAFHRKI